MGKSLAEAIRSAIGPRELATRIVEILNTAEDPNTKLAAIKLLCERGWGKPPETVELSGPDGGPIPVSTFDFNEYARAFQAVFAGNGAEENPQSDSAHTNGEAGGIPGASE